MTVSGIFRGIGKILACVLVIGGIYLIYQYQEEILAFMDDLTNPRRPIVSQPSNDYKVKWDFAYVQNTNDYEPNNYQELLNIFYTAVNSGWEKFTFYCAKEYKTCTDDAEELASNSETLSIINNFVHPFNSYRTLDTKITGKYQIDLTINHLYTDNQIKEIGNRVESLIGRLTNEKMSNREKIRAIHDYIINNTKYDKNMVDDNATSKYHSNIAYGPLFEGYAICSGYSDAMQIFLFDLGIKNYKISSKEHIWNFVYLDDGWLHLDLTGDDPIMSDGSDRLKHDYFLITSDTLEKLNDNNSHTYNKSFFKEAK